MVASIWVATPDVRKQPDSGNILKCELLMDKVWEIMNKEALIITAGFLA